MYTNNSVANVKNIECDEYRSQVPTGMNFSSQLLFSQDGGVQQSSVVHMGNRQPGGMAINVSSQ